MLWEQIKQASTAAAGPVWLAEASRTIPGGETNGFSRLCRRRRGSPDRIGKWAIYGVARGYMEGSEGKSYAIQTIQKPGKKRSTSLQEIQKQLAEMWDFSAAHPELQFILTPIGEGYAGYSHKEMQEVWDWIKANKGERPNWSWLADMRDRAAMT